MHHGVSPAAGPGCQASFLAAGGECCWPEVTRLTWSDQLVVSSPISLKNMFVKMASVHPQFSGWKVQRICWNYHPVIWLSQGSFSKIHVTRWRNEGQQSTKAYLKQLCLVGRLASINVFLSQVAPKQVPKQTIAFTRTWPLSSLFNGSQIVSDTNKIPNFKIICIKGK